MKAATIKPASGLEGRSERVSVTRAGVLGGKTAPRESARPNDRAGRFEGYPQPPEQLAHDRFVGCQQSVRFGRQFKVHISNRPADSGSSRRWYVQGDRQHRLGLLPNHVPGGGRLKHRFAMTQRRHEFEGEFRAIVRLATPRRLAECPPIGANRHFRQGRIAGDKRRDDRMHPPSQEIIHNGNKSSLRVSLADGGARPQQFPACGAQAAGIAGPSY